MKRLHLSFTALLAASVLSLGAANAVAKDKKVKPSKQLPEATAEQHEAMKLVHLGNYQCELGQSLDVTPHKTTAGYVDVAFKRYHFTMKPVLSSTGAVRLEDVSGRALMVQIANKSMLMDNKVGQRLVDDCVSAGQKTATAATR
jgi:hypothetical protein